MKEYYLPSAELILFDYADIMTESGGCDCDWESLGQLMPPKGTCDGLSGDWTEVGDTFV